MGESRSWCLPGLGKPEWEPMGMEAKGPVLTLHPVPAHWAEEVGVEAEGFVDLPEDLADISDL